MSRPSSRWTIGGGSGRGWVVWRHLVGRQGGVDDRDVDREENDHGKHDEQEIAAGLRGVSLTSRGGVPPGDEQAGSGNHQHGGNQHEGAEARGEGRQLAMATP